MATDSSQSNVVADLRADWRRRWLSGDRVPVETFLSHHPEFTAREQDVVELIAAEVALRQSQGERPDRVEYVGRFPAYAAQLEKLFAPKATLGSVGGGSTRKDAPAGIMETAGFDQPNIDNFNSAALATSSFSMLPDETGADHLRATASFGPAPTRVNPPSGTAPRPSTPDNAAGTTIGRYTVTKRLGEGAFGLVYLAFDNDLKRQVAIKVPHPHMVASAASADAYLSEAQSVARLDHPGIVPVYDVGRTEDGQCYVVSKYIAGGSLDRTMKERRPFEQSAKVVADIAEALHHAHQRGLVHRDIKPANILVDESGRPLVADFGLALKDEEFGKGGTFSGTPAYMSPEQARREGHVVDARSDIYSLGVVLFELLTGKLPYRGKTVTEILNEVVTIEVRPPKQIDDKVPDELDHICNKALSKKPSDRYSTALDMAKALRAAVAKPGEQARPARSLAMAAGALIVLAGGYWLLRNQAGTDPASREPSGFVASVPGDLSSGGSSAGISGAGVQLEVHCQRKAEDEMFKSLTPKDPPLTNGDKVQVHVHSAKPQYLYVYWYDPAGQSRRLWPEDPSSQHEQTDLALPPERDKWFTIDGSRGNEMVVVGAAEKPLDETALAALEQTPSFAAGNHTVSGPLLLPISGTERGLGATVTSRKSPLDSHFEDLLRADFPTYRGIVLPHQ